MCGWCHITASCAESRKPGVVCVGSCRFCHSEWVPGEPTLYASKRYFSSFPPMISTMPQRYLSGWFLFKTAIIQGNIKLFPPFVSDKVCCSLPLYQIRRHYPPESEPAWRIASHIATTSIARSAWCVMYFPSVTVSYFCLSAGTRVVPRLGHYCSALTAHQLWLARSVPRDWHETMLGPPSFLHLSKACEGMGKLL